VQVLNKLPRVTDKNVLVGTDGIDDAAVYRINATQAIVQTLDFFTPIVDDPTLFGEISAANSISDIYAMGARPLFALNIVAYPMATLGPEILAQILSGGSKKAGEAGIFVVGGHSIDDAEPKYGMSVTGIVHPDKIMANSGAKPGDVLILTKPLGVGILTTSVKRGLRTEAQIDAAIHSMASLNKPGAEAIEEVGANSATDVTGFGLIGHLCGMAGSSKVGIEIDFAALPVLPDVMDFIKQGVIPGGTKKNHKFYAPRVEYAAGLSEAEQLLCCDAQTSGGMVISTPASKAEAMVNALKKHGALSHAIIGKVVTDHPGKIVVK
jgi:selenide,water dikinase